MSIWGFKREQLPSKDTSKDLSTCHPAAICWTARTGPGSVRSPAASRRRRRKLRPSCDVWQLPSSDRSVTFSGNFQVRAKKNNFERKQLFWKINTNNGCPRNYKDGQCDQIFAQDDKKLPKREKCCPNRNFSLVSWIEAFRFFHILRLPINHIWTGSYFLTLDLSLINLAAKSFIRQ